MYSSTPDTDLIAAARGGDTHALPALFDRHHQSLVQVARRVTPCHSSAEDAVSEAFLGLLRALSHGKGPTTHVWAYLASSVRRAAARRSGQEEGRLSPFAASHVDVAEEVAEQLTVRRAFATLPARWRVVLWLVEVEGLNRVSAAAAVGSSPAALAMTASRARRGLRAAYLRESA